MKPITAKIILTIAFIIISPFWIAAVALGIWFRLLQGGFDFGYEAMSEALQTLFKKGFYK